MRPGGVKNTVRALSPHVRKHYQGREESRESVDVTRGEQVEAELDAMIRRCHDQRVLSEGERLEDELCQESVDRYNTRRREENRIAWCAYYRGVAGALYARAEEYIVRAEKLSEAAEQGRG
jgi:hypothetical protein